MDDILPAIHLSLISRLQRQASGALLLHHLHIDLFHVYLRIELRRKFCLLQQLHIHPGRHDAGLPMVAV